MRISLPSDKRTVFQETWSTAAQKTIVACANGSGGFLCLGVTQTGDVVGCDYDETAGAVFSFANDGVAPTLRDFVRVEPIRLDGKTVAVVCVLPGAETPVCLKGIPPTQGVFVRRNGKIVAVTIDDVLRSVRFGKRREWEVRPAQEEPLTFSDTTTIFDEAGLSFERKIWSELGLLDKEGGFTNLALLLSDQNPSIIRLNFYRPDGTFEHAERLTGPLLRQASGLWQRLDALSSTRPDRNTGSKGRRETRSRPPAALRTAIRFFITHRNYDFPVDAVVNVFANRLTFMAKGALPPQTPFEGMRLSEADCCPNRRLADLLRRLDPPGLACNGFADLSAAYAGLRQRPVVQHMQESFVLELPLVAVASRSEV